MMGWTFKTVDHEPVIISPDKDKHNPETGHFYDPNISYDNCGENRKHPQTGETLVRITVQEYNELTGVRMPHTHLAGNGWTGKDISSEERHKKKLRDNPMYTSMNDYKMSNPTSIPSKALKKNKKKLEKKNIKIRKNETKGV